jgi:hypothetical protein
MPSYLSPGVYVEEVSSGNKPIEGVSTSVAAFVGITIKGPVAQPVFITSFAEFVKNFGGPIQIIPGSQEHYLYYSVRQFFLEGGTRCFVVRVVHYGAVDDALTISAVSSSNTFDGLQEDGITTVSPALTITAANPGDWGDGLEVQIESSSAFSLLLGKDLVGGPAVNQLTLLDNQDIRIGSVLHLVREITGIVRSVDTVTGIITFEPMRTGPHYYSADPSITNGMTVVTPDYKLQTTVVVGSSVTAREGIVTDPIGLSSLQLLNGENIKIGSVINFINGQETLLEVTRIDFGTITGIGRVMIVDTAQNITVNFERDTARVYARDFDLAVRQGATEIERHLHLSLSAANSGDNVENRLAPGGSPTITATISGPSVLIMKNASFTHLGGGNNGWAGLTDADFVGSPVVGSGIHGLDKTKDPGILVMPNASRILSQSCVAYCEGRKNLFYIMDFPNGSGTPIESYPGFSSSYTALYYPWIQMSDPSTGKKISVPPSGAVAGTYAFTDMQRGVHKAPAGINEGYLDSAEGIEKIVTKGENDILYQRSVNVIRKFSEGIMVWGTRTLSSDPEWKYVNVRRLFIYLEQSIERGTQWVVFEPNDISLWATIRRNISAFLRIQWRDGMLAGQKEEEAFFVQCDRSTNPPEIVDAGQVVTLVGVAPLKPAEFVVFRFQQMAGKTSK